MGNLKGGTGVFKACESIPKIKCGKIHCQYVEMMSFIAEREKEAKSFKIL
jgi:hypothetical protein